jgi:hypothetical protein
MERGKGGGEIKALGAGKRRDVLMQIFRSDYELSKDL